MSHGGAVHGRRAVERQLVIGTVCPSCPMDFRTRRRARKHLRYGASACVEAARAGLLPVHEATAVAAADRPGAAARLSARRRGVEAGAGLPALPAAVVAAAAAAPAEAAAATGGPGPVSVEFLV
jgi:hypothetical protein